MFNRKETTRTKWFGSLRFDAFACKHCVRVSETTQYLRRYVSYVHTYMFPLRIFAALPTKRLQQQQLWFHPCTIYIFHLCIGLRVDSVGVFWFEPAAGDSFLLNVEKNVSVMLQRDWAEKLYFTELTRREKTKKKLFVCSVPLKR